MATVAKLGMVQEIREGPAVAAPEFAARHFSPSEIAELWNLSVDSVRKLFENEPGVVQIGERARRGKRRYVTLRIPESVVARVHRKLSRV